MLIALADLRLHRPRRRSRPAVNTEQQAYEGVICEGSSVQQEAAPSSEIPISGAPACNRLHPIIFGRSQILPSRPLFTVAYLINLFTPKKGSAAIKVADRMATNGKAKQCQRLNGRVSYYGRTETAHGRIRGGGDAGRGVGCPGTDRPITVAAHRVAGHALETRSIIHISSAIVN